MECYPYENHGSMIWLKQNECSGSFNSFISYIQFFSLRGEDPFTNPFDNPVDNPALPRVLIIGDSISIGYTPRVRKLLKGKANVHRPKTNCRWSAFGNEKILDWIGNSKWDLIHFNFGLWDWYGWKQPNKSTPNPMRRIWRALLKSLNQPVPNSYLR